MTKVITINNFKGGVSKTSTTIGMAYILSNVMKFKTLVIDIDPQADATETLLLSFGGQIKNSLYKTFEEQLDVNDCIVNLNETLDILPSDFNMIGFPQLLEELGYNRFDGASCLDSLIDSIKENYDFILIDTPPTISDYSSNAIYACDYSLIVMQTHKRSFRAVEKFIQYLALFKDNYQLDFEIAGILPVMFKKDGKIDRTIIDEAKEKYGDYLFSKYIFQRDRVKLWDETGITNDDYHDKNALSMYYDITVNLLEEIEKYESE
ncbi:ParA family protein [Staphylococcus agnetis]|uniref:ParA family protein n=1 Tax=Staphylococcus agnetis TaxID=985762 RepID=UPI00071F2D77|nr:ParA family protein [Staphylococcus agnetis]ALN78157.1 ParA family protein [Staphylococcus agnetis]NJI14392.1 AAA family ATPase [Staphylococcus agnetis]HEE8876747.1 ParA family protein [Staphylococcus aureus]